jgi:probable HAF family extracellular repeat protein
VVGGATTEPGLEYGAPDTHAFIWKDGQMIDLGTLDGGDFSTANGVNKNGEVVGFSGDPNAENPNNSMTACLWDEDGQIINLNDVVSDSTGWCLVTALGINDNGQITGLGIYEGQYRGFLLDPKK